MKKKLAELIEMLCYDASGDEGNVISGELSKRLTAKATAVESK